MSVKPIPDGYTSVTAYLAIKGAAQAIEFYKKVFGATEVMRLATPDGTIMHAEINIGGSMMMLADPYEPMGFRDPNAIGGSPVNLHLYVEDVDAVFNRAVAAGATVLRPVQNQFYGDRTGTLRDPFGHIWSVATHVEDVPPEEIERRSADMMKNPS